MEKLKLILKQWNPWWADGRISKTKTKIQRNFYIRKITKLLNAREIICLSGVRRCGKSTLMHQIIEHLINRKINPKNILYFNFDAYFQTKSIDLFNKIIDKYIQLNNPKGKKYFFLMKYRKLKNGKNL